MAVPPYPHTRNIKVSREGTYLNFISGRPDVPQEHWLATGIGTFKAKSHLLLHTIEQPLGTGKELRTKSADTYQVALSQSL